MDTFIIIPITNAEILSTIYKVYDGIGRDRTNLFLFVIPECNSLMWIRHLNTGLLDTINMTTMELYINVVPKNVGFPLGEIPDPEEINQEITFTATNYFKTKEMKNDEIQS